MSRFFGLGMRSGSGMFQSRPVRLERPFVVLGQHMSPRKPPDGWLRQETPHTPTHQCLTESHCITSRLISALLDIASFPTRERHGSPLFASTKHLLSYPRGQTRRHDLCVPSHLTIRPPPSPPFMSSVIILCPSFHSPCESYCRATDSPHSATRVLQEPGMLANIFRS